MKTISQCLDELLKSYQKYYHCRLRLVSENQSVFSGFEGEAKSSIELRMRDGLSELHSDCFGMETQLQVMAIALKQLLEMNSTEDVFLSVLNGSKDELELHRLKGEMSWVPWVLVLIETNGDLLHLKQLAEQIVSQKGLIGVIDHHLVLLMERKEEMNQFLMSMKDTLETELYSRVQLAVSPPFDDVKLLNDHYEGVKRYRRLCDHYDPSCVIADDAHVWMMEMIDSLSKEIAEKLKKSLITEGVSALDEELITTIHCFLANSLSISATARELYVHRNTLIYRLDKIAQNTGLDIRHFEDAMKLRLALLLNKK